MQPDVSIIIPAYNAEDFIGKCLDSVLGQSLRSIEVIVVNDGSTDSTGAVIDSYAASDPRVKAIHTANRTTPYARRTGVDAASGRYLCFVDNDDSLPDGALEALVDAARESGAEVVSGNYYMSEFAGSDDFRLVTRSLESGSGVEALRQTLLGNFGYVVWSRLFDTGFYRRTITETPPYCPGDDGIVLVQLLANAERVVQTDAPVYCYILRVSSQSVYGASWSREYRMKYIYQMRWIADYVKKIPAIASDGDTLAYFYLYMWANLLSKNSGGVSPEEKDIEDEVYGTYYKNRRARGLLRKKLPKLWIYLCAERNPFMRLTRNVLWGSDFSRKSVRRMYRAVKRLF